MRKHILVVEDTPDLLANIVDVLEMEGYSVSQSANGAEAIKVCQKRVPDLIITDLLMPKMNGFELIDQVRSKMNWSAIQILVYSAMPPVVNRKIVLTKGANFYLKKPSSVQSLITAVHQLIKK
jgi:CheY-like chemotaxis protein